MRKTPLILHQIWYQGLDHIAEPYKRCFATVLEGLEGTGWQHMFWDKERIEKLISDNYPQYWQLYNFFPNLIQKLDISRYIILHYHGGCYLDMDVAWLKDFSVLIDNDDELIVSNTMQRFINNGTLISSPKNEFWLDFLNDINDKKVKRFYYDTFLYVQLTTGPLSFNNFVKNNRRKYKIKILDFHYLEPCKSKYNSAVTDKAFLINYYGNSWINPIYGYFIYIYSYYKYFSVAVLLILIIALFVF